MDKTKPVKMLTVPNGLTYNQDTKQWTYKFSACFQFANNGDDLNPVITDFGKWTSKITKANLSISGDSTQYALTPVMPKGFDLNVRITLWWRLFISNFQKNEVLKRQADPAVAIESFFDLATFGNIRKSYIQKPESGRGNYFDESYENYHSWQLHKLQYFVPGFAGNNITQQTEVKALHRLTRDVSNHLDNFNQKVNRFYHANEGLRSVAEDTKYDAFKVLAHLSEQFEINRWLGLIHDFEYTDVDGILEAYFNSPGVKNQQIQITLDPTEAALNTYLDQNIPTKASFYNNGQERMIFSTGSNAADIPQTDRGLMLLSDALVTKSEHLADFLSNEERASTLAIHTPFIPATTALTEKAITELSISTRGLYLYVKNLSGLAKSGIIDENTAVFSEPNLTIGHRVGVIRNDLPQDCAWTLCSKSVTYQVQPGDVTKGITITEPIAEGFIRADAGTHTGNDQITIDEKFVYWNGDPLCNNSIFPFLAQNGQPETEDGSLQAINKAYELETHYGRTPRLRYGKTYSFVASNVMMNGWSIPFQTYKGIEGQLTVQDILKTEGKQSMVPTSTILFSRSEVVNAPDFVLDAPLSNTVDTKEIPVAGKEGESLTQMVIRNPGKGSTSAICTRYLIPPSISGQQAAWHGSLDSFSTGTVDSFIDGPDARALTNHSTYYDKPFVVPFLPDPMATHLSFSFFLDPDHLVNAGAYITFHCPKEVQIYGAGEIIQIPNAFPNRQWPYAASWNVTLSENLEQVKPYVVDIDMVSRTIDIKLIKGAELFGVTHFMGIEEKHAVLSGLTLNLRQLFTGPLGQGQDSFKTLGDVLTNLQPQLLFRPAEGAAGGPKFVDVSSSYIDAFKKLFFGSASFSLTHASKLPVQPAKLFPGSKSPFSLQRKSSKETVAFHILGIRQKQLKDGTIRWTTAPPANGVFSNLYDTTKLYLTQTEVKICEFADFEHLNALIDYQGDQQAALLLAKTGGLALVSSWNEYQDDDRSQFDKNGYLLPIVINREEHGFQLNRLTEPATATSPHLMHSEDLQLFPSALKDIDYTQETAENAQNSFSSARSLLDFTVDQHDNKHRKKRLKLNGHSKFSSLFPKDLADPEFTLPGVESAILIVPANAKPQIVAVHKIMPLIVRENAHLNGRLSVVKTGNSFRVYLSSTWWSSGAEERLGVLCYDPTDNNLPFYQQDQRYDLLSKVGRDITSKGKPLNPDSDGFLKDSDITEFFGNPCDKKRNSLENMRDYLTAAETENHPEPIYIPMGDVYPSLSCWAIIPRYNQEIGKWYIDLTVNNELAELSHAPFIELKLIRYQPFGLNYENASPSDSIRDLYRGTHLGPPSGLLENDYRYSDHATADIFYLHPKREIAAYETRIGITVEIKAASGTLKRNGDGMLQTEFWVGQERLIANDVYELQVDSMYPFDPANITGDLWKQEFQFNDFRGRLIIKEYELFTNSKANFSGPELVNDNTRREVYSELIILNHTW